MGVDWKLLGGLAVVAGTVAAVGTETGRNFVQDLTRRGSRLTKTTLDADGKVPIDPFVLADQAGQVLNRAVDADAYALARMLRSEEGSAGPVVKRLLGWVALNDAAELGWDLLELFTFSTVAARKGYFGKQISRRYSTAQDPYENDLAIAELVIGELAAGKADPTSGAVKFVNKDAFASQAGASSYEAVRARWAKEGLSPVLLAGAPDNLVFFRRGGDDVA
jgi:hypothetical protein